ncbi:MAG: hypothetical protein R6V17_07810 [Halanaerobacter sp.]
MADEEVLELILDKITSLDNKVDSLDNKVDSLDDKIDGLELRLDNLEKEVQKNRTMIKNNSDRLDIVVRQVNENNQILKQENVQKWLKLGSQVMEHWQEKS